MGTRCYIGFENQDKSVIAIYCHFDGYPSGVGKKLSEHYTDPEKIQKLLELGDLSSLGSEPVANPDAWTASPYQNYSENDPRCITYKSRGELNRDAKKYNSVLSFRNSVRGSDAEFAYLYRDGMWRLLLLGRGGVTLTDIKYNK